MRKNKYHYDLKNVHYAKGTKKEDGTIEYMPPKRMLGAMSMDISSEGDTTKTRADGTDYIVSVSNNGYSGSVTFVQVPDDFKKDCLEEKTDETNGIQYEDANVEQSPFALLFEFAGDVKNKRHILYNCTASRPSIAGDNKESQKEPDTEELELTSSPTVFVIDGEERSIVKANSTEDTKPEAYNSWYSQVIIPGKAVEKTAKLASLQIGALKLTPDFSPSINSYAADTTNATNTVKATSTDPAAIMEIKLGDTVIQNGASATWATGANALTVNVTNGEATEKYTVTVTKGA